MATETDRKACKRLCDIGVNAYINQFETIEGVKEKINNFIKEISKTNGDKWRAKKAAMSDEDVARDIFFSLGEDPCEFCPAAKICSLETESAKLINCLKTIRKWLKRED